MHKKIKYGFTLAELMAVVIIVALLAILSAGYYRRSVEQARFSEGLMNASTIAEGINRAYLEQQTNGITSPAIPALNHLDIDISVGCGAELCTTTYFTISVDENGVTTAVRRDGIYGNKYRIQIWPHFAIANRDQIACVVPSKDPHVIAFCQGMGYTSCTDGGVCAKPN